jgi:mRNA interferase HigB
MRITGRERLEKFCESYPDARKWIERWLGDVASASWRSPHEMRRQYASASFIGKTIVIFNVKGNSYRLEAAVAYRSGIVDVLWAGSHAEYDRRNRER